MARTVLKSPWILGEVREKSLNSIFPWKVLKFLVAWKVFFDAFVWPRQNINHGLENLKVIYKKCSMFYAIINYHAILDKWTEKRKEVGEANSSNLKVLIDWECAFFYSLWIIFLVGGPWKYNVVLEESLKSGCLCLYEPWPSPVTQLTVFLSYPPIPDFLGAPAPSFARCCDTRIFILSL